MPTATTKLRNFQLTEQTWDDLTEIARAHHLFRVDGDPDSGLNRTAAVEWLAQRERARLNRQTKQETER